MVHERPATEPDDPDEQEIFLRTAWRAALFLFIITLNSDWLSRLRAETGT